MNAAPPVIPYGCAAVPPRLDAVRCAHPQPGRKLRLRDGGEELAEPPAPGSAPLAALAERLAALCDPWATAPRRFLARYVALITATIAERADELAARLARFGDLYRIEDFAFSALRPLPRAHVRRADGSGWIAVDFGFWSGDAVITLEVADARRTARRRAAEHAALQEAGAIVVALAPALLDSETAVLAGQLPAPLRDFLDGETLPGSPFAAGALGDIVDRAWEP